MYICIYISIYTYVYTHIYIYFFVAVSIHTYIYISADLHRASCVLDYTASLPTSQLQPSNQLDKPSKQAKQAFKRQAKQAFQTIVQAVL